MQNQLLELKRITKKAEERTGDDAVAKAGSGITTFAVPDSAGMPQSITSETLVVPYKNLETVNRIAGQHANDIACILVEPIAANMGVIPPVEDFLEGLKQLCDSIGAILIFDEVITGFLSYDSFRK